MLSPLSFRLFILTLLRFVCALGCVSRSSGQYMQDSSFDILENPQWGYGGAFISNNPSYPSRAGNAAM